jgi:ketosteroid isomerase-like protein
MDENAEVVLGVFKAVEERDREKLLDLHHDDAELLDAASLPYGGTLRGKETLRERLESAPEGTWLGTWGPLQPTAEERRMDPRVVSSNDGEVVVLYRQRGVAPDGERFDSPVLGLYEVRDGKFFRAQMFHYDTAAALAFLERAAGARKSQVAT